MLRNVKTWIMNVTWLSLLSLSLSCHAQSAGVFKWVDKNGAVHYGDRPAQSSEPLKSESVMTKPKWTTADNEKALKELATQLRNAAEASRLKEEKEKKKKESAELAKSKEAGCIAAKESQRLLSTGAKLSTLNENGERVPLDETTRKLRIEEAQKIVEESCNVKQ